MVPGGTAGNAQGALSPSPLIRLSSTVVIGVAVWGGSDERGDGREMKPEKKKQPKQCDSRFHCVTFAESEPYCHSILFVCLSGCLSVIPRPTAYHDWSITTKFGRPVYTCPRTRVSLFGSLSPILWVPEGKYAIFRLFPTRILATANVMHRAIWLVFIITHTVASVTLSVRPCVRALRGKRLELSEPKSVRTYNPWQLLAALRKWDRKLYGKGHTGMKKSATRCQWSVLLYAAGVFGLHVGGTAHDSTE